MKGALMDTQTANATGSQKTNKRASRREQADFLKGCNPDERCYCVRLIRLLRDDYWMAELVRQILDKEAQSKYGWGIKDLRKLIDNFDVIEALADNAQRLGHNWSNHPILRAIRQEWGGDDEIEKYKSDRRIQRLIDSAHGCQSK
ncbi:MAG TPA: hypothetical protein VGK64_12615 [Bryobacteraceae bacterium]